MKDLLYGSRNDVVMDQDLIQWFKVSFGIEVFFLDDCGIAKMSGRGGKFDPFHA